MSLLRPVLLFLKARLPGVAGDLFAAPTQVEGHVTKQGTFVAPYTAIRHKRPEQAPAPKPAPQADLFSVPAPEPPSSLESRPAESSDERQALSTPAPAPEPLADRPDLLDWKSSEFSEVTKRLTAEGAAPFSAEDVARHWMGHTAEEAADILHADAVNYAVDRDGERFAPMAQYLANTSPTQALEDYRAASGDLPAHILRRLHNQYEALDRAAQEAWDAEKSMIKDRLRAVAAGYRAIGDERRAAVAERMADRKVVRPVLPQDVEGIERTLAEKVREASTYTIAKPWELDFDRARMAHYWNSMDPDRWAENEQRRFANAVNGVYADLDQLAETPEQKSSLLAMMQDFKRDYLARTYEVLSATGKTASSMVTGPARFPVAKNQKALAREQTKKEEFKAWHVRAVSAMRKKLISMRSPERAQDHAVEGLKRHFDRDIAEIQAIDAGTSPMDRTAFTRSIASKLKRLHESGHVEVFGRLRDYVAERQRELPKPILAPNNAVWSLSATPSEKQGKVEPESSPEEVGSFAGGRVINNREAERVQILFDAKPDAAMREKLKRAGWRWSPSNGAWQRQNTANAVASAREILGLTRGP